MHLTKVVPFLVEDELKRLGSEIRESRQLAAHRHRRRAPHHRAESTSSTVARPSASELLRRGKRRVAETDGEALERDATVRPGRHDGTCGRDQTIGGRHDAIRARCKSNKRATRCPRARGSPSRTFSSSPTSSARFASTRRSSAAALLEPRRQRRRAGVPSRSRTLGSSRQRRRRADSRQAVGDAQHVPDPDKINGFMNIRVADIQACYELWEKPGSRVHHDADA